MNETLRSQVAIPLSFLFPPHGSAALEKNTAYVHLASLYIVILT